MPPNHLDEGLQAGQDHSSPSCRHRRARPLAVTSRSYAVQLLDDGAEGVGYLLKDRIAEIDRFIDAVRRVGEGGSVLHPRSLPTCSAGASATSPCRI